LESRDPIPSPGVERVNPSLLSTLRASAERESPDRKSVVIPPALDAERYTMVREYGRGGMGRVLLVYDELLNRDIALKELLPGNRLGAEMDLADFEGATPKEVERFLQEARITGQLEHPSIVSVYDLGRVDDGTLCYTMKLVRGRSLGTTIREAGSLRGRLDLLSHFVDVCQAIAYAHSEGVVHRDIKPGNIMVGEFGETVVLDWGIARIVNRDDIHAEGLTEAIQKMNQGDEDQVEATVYGQAIGTPVYMPPEQAKGFLDEIDEQSDVYALGAVLYELITGEPPFAPGGLRETLKHVIEDEPTPIRTLEPTAPPELVAICERAMSKKRASRYESAADVAEEIRRFQTGALVQTYSYRPSEHVRRFTTRYKAILAVAAAAFVILIGGGIYAGLRITEQRNIALVNEDLAEYEEYKTKILLASNQVEQGQFDLANDTLWSAPEEHRNWEWGYLLNAANQDIYSLKGHSFAHFSPDGTMIVTASYSKPLTIWNAADGTELVSVPDLEKVVVDFGFHPVKPLVVVALIDGTVRGINATTGELAWTLSPSRQRLFGMAFNADGTVLAAASADGSIVVWDYSGETPVEARRVPSKLGGARSKKILHGTGIQLNDTGTQVCVEWLQDDWKTGEFELWDIQKSPAKFRNTFSGVSPHFGPEETLLYATERRAVLVDLDSGSEVRDFRGHSSTVFEVTRNSVNGQIMTVSEDGEAKVWMLEEERKPVVLSVENNSTTGNSSNRVSRGAFSADGLLIATVVGDREIVVWDSATGDPVNTLNGHSDPINGLEFNPNNTSLISGSINSTKLWHARKTLSHRVESDTYDRIHDLELSSDGKTLAILSGRKRLDLRDGETNALLHSFEVVGSIRDGSVAFSPSGRRVVATLDPFTPIVFDVETGALVTFFQGHAGRVESLAFGPEERLVLSGSADFTAKVWDVETGIEHLTLSGHEDRVTSAEYSEDGKKIVTGSMDETVKIWDASTGREIQTLAPKGGMVSAVGFEANDAFVVCGTTDGFLRMYNTKTGTWVAKHSIDFLPNAIEMEAFVFSPDGDRLLVSSKEGIRIWDWPMGIELVHLPLGLHHFPDIDISLDGLTVVAASNGNLHRLEAERWTDRQNAGQPITNASFRAYRLSGFHEQARSNVNEPYTHIVLTTKPILRNSIEEFEVAVRTKLKDASIGESEVGHRINVGQQENPLGPLTFKATDHVAAINGKPIDSSTSLTDALDALLKSIGESNDERISIDVVRNKKYLSVDYRFVPETRKTQEMTVTSSTGLGFLRSQRDHLFRSVDGVRRDQQLYAEDVGKPQPSHDELDGLLLNHDETTSAMERFMQLGFAVGDRLMGINGNSISSVDALLDFYDHVIAEIESGKDAKLVHEIERGQFQRNRLTLFISSETKNPTLAEHSGRR
jgi:WD40 repeat protein